MTNFKTLAVLGLAGTMLATGFTGSAFADDTRRGGQEQSLERGAAFRAGERFAHADTDGNRMISLEEFQTATQARFAALDADGDGLVTPAEMVAQRQRANEERAAERLATIDTNEDGALSLDEMTAAGDARFARMDGDDDGNLEPREMRRMMRGGEHGEGRERGQRDGRGAATGEPRMERQAL